MRTGTKALLVVLAACLPGIVRAAPDPDSLVRGSGTAVYYCAGTGVRYVFPDEKTYFSWFTDFSGVTRVTDAELSEIPLAGSVTYRPGIRLLKLQTDPRVYAVAPGGVLRGIASEAVAKGLYGFAWNLAVDDVPDAFFTNYSIGVPVESSNEFSPEAAAEAARTINDDKDIPAGKTAPESDTVPGGEDPRIREWREIALEDINRIRVEHGKPPLKMNPLLNHIAFIHTQDMVRNGFFEHVGSLGEIPDDRIRNGTVPDLDARTLVTVPHPERVAWTGENLGQATMRNALDDVKTSIERLHQRFLDEPADQPNHRTTMLSTLHPYAEIGIGPYVNAQNTLWLTEDFISLP